VDVLIEAKALLMVLVLLLLAGCATPGRRPQLADWQSEESAPAAQASELASAVAPAAAEVSPAMVPDKPLIPIVDKWVPLNRWCKLNNDVYQRTGKLLEKYNVMDTHLESGGGEYPTQDGFGWTNGVLLALLKKYSIQLQ